MKRSQGFTAVSPTIEPNASAISSGEAKPIKSIADALAAIALIKSEGEGTEGSPAQPPTGSTDFAHYYVFKQIYTQKTLVHDTAGHWSFSGPPIPFPTWFDFQQSNATPSPSLGFNQAISQLLTGLQACWATGAKPSIDAMFELKTLGVDLIKRGIRPEFIWV